MISYAEMRTTDVVHREGSPLFIDGVWVGEIYNHDKGVEICKKLNSARERETMERQYQTSLPVTRYCPECGAELYGEACDDGTAQRAESPQ